MTAMTSRSATTLDPQRYFELIDADTDRLLEMGERGLRQQVPSCAGWDVAEVVWHVAGVYEHKTRVLADNAWPEQWPPADFEGKEEIGFLQDARAHLFEEFARHDVDEQTQTFGADSTVAFWVRRMAHEIAVHRYDGELAHGDPTDIPVDEAIDGIDEVLTVMLGGPWWEEQYRTSHPVDALVAVESDALRWVCDIREKQVTVSSEGDAGEVAATVSGSPMHVFLWLWGRLDDDAVELSGDSAVLREFRARLVECSG
ncbi:MAG: hypothetical protein AVDCRST_MAG21-1822 [uncultured Nocardioidaceae bacterium]|uniref:Mycothiol-dependent maleylpyruvate isomerase metal-binding domain-containing protein n=1 Tax=uncultured Nocardioidaceae bacterium TaxID=253824 RepID=A0A6J4NE95_9ACTN|nr:MAG: hypothetical protein AVDCRST_MAG21-1822 [uncultured Nocardioidaceae bacterium]